MLALVALTLLCLAPAPQDPAALLPPDTVVYFGTDSVRAGAETAKKSAMHLIMNEPEVKAFLQKPVALLDRVLEEAVKERGLESPPITVSEMVHGGGEAPPVGQMFMAITHVSLEQSEDAVPDIGLVVGIEMLDESHLALLKGLWDKIPAPQQEATHAGRAYYLKQPEEGAPALALSFIGNTAVLSLSEKTLHGIIERAGKDTAASLAQSADYRGYLDKAGGLRQGGTTLFVRPSGLTDMLRLGVTMALTKNGQEEMIPKVVGLIDQLGVDAITVIGSTSYRDADGLVHSTGVVKKDRAVQGLVPALWGSIGALDLEPLQEIPGDAMSAKGGSLPDLPQLYDFAMNALETIDADLATQAREGIAAATGDVDLRNDVLARIGGAYYSFSMANKGFMGQPASIMRIETTDAQAFVDAFASLLGSVGKMTGFEAPLVKSEEDGIYELDLSKTPGAALMVQPGIAIDGNDLVVSLESKTLLREFLQGEVGEGKLTDKPSVSAFLAKLEKDGEVLGLSYTDLAETFSTYYGQVMASVTMVGQGADLPVDLSLLPTEGAIAQHLGEMLSGEAMAGDGSVIVSRSQSQFGMGDFVPVAVMGAMLALLGESDMLPTDAEVAAQIDPRDAALNDMRQLKAGLTIYKISMGGYPDSLDAIVQPLPDYPNGCLGTSELPVDPWGNPYAYRVEDRKVVLWSTGPDGIDQGGAGDDIVK